MYGSLPASVMYIGFFLLIPYLNIVYHQLADRKQKRGLVLTFLFLTSIPCVTNHFFTVYNEQHFPFQLLPQWWIFLYPVTYYYVGAYLRDYPIKLRMPLLSGLLLLSVLFNSVFSYWKSYGDLFLQGDWQAFCSILNLVQACLLFSF